MQLTMTQTVVLCWCRSTGLGDGVHIRSECACSPHHNAHADLYHALQSLVSAVKQLADEPESKEKNRIGVLLGTKQTQATKTLTHVMWVLFNVLPAGTTQKPHRHSPTALDFAITAPSKGDAHSLAQLHHAHQAYNFIWHRKGLVMT